MVWGFVAKTDGVTRKVPHKRGDLFYAASWDSPAKHARGNILEGSARYTEAGPEMLPNWRI